MAMTLRLPPELNDEVRAQADAEGRSIQTLAHDALREYIERHRVRSDVAEATKWVITEYREALDRLGKL